jgi:hypothetical protein
MQLKAEVTSQRQRLTEEKNALEQERSLLAEKQDAARELRGQLQQLIESKEATRKELIENECETARLNDEANAILCAYESVVKQPLSARETSDVPEASDETASAPRQARSSKESEISRIKSQRDALNEEINALHMTYLSLRANADVNEKELKESAFVAAGLAAKCKDMVEMLNGRLKTLQDERDLASSVLLNCNKELMRSQEHISQRV